MVFFLFNILIFMLKTANMTSWFCYTEHVCPIATSRLACSTWDGRSTSDGGNGHASYGYASDGRNGYASDGSWSNAGIRDASDGKLLRVLQIAFEEPR